MVDEPYEARAREQAENLVARGDVDVALDQQIVPKAVHEFAEPLVVLEREIRGVHATDPARQRSEVAPVDAPHLTGRGVDDHDGGDLLAAPADRRAAQRAKVLRVAAVVELQRGLENLFGAVGHVDVTVEVVVEEGGGNVTHRGALAQLRLGVGILGTHNDNARARAA